MEETLGPYKLVAPIARGGMAETFVGERTGLAGFAQRVCVKRILAQDSADPKWIRLFQREARIAATLQHPNIVGLHDFGRDGAVWWMSLESGRVLCWGQFYDDALPLDRARYALVPEEVILPFAVDEVAPLYNGSCARGSGRVVCWGDNRHGELGTGELGPHRDAVEVLLPEPAIQLATDSFTLPCARTESGVWCWGQVPYTTTITSSPELIAGLVGDERLQSGMGSVYALRDGGAWVWGFNSSSNTFPSHSTSGGTRDPVLAELPSGIARVYPGSVAGFALTGDGTLYSWGGHGGAAQLGREPVLGRAEPPAPVTGFSPLADFAANSALGCGLDQLGMLSCWRIGRVPLDFHSVAMPESVSRLWGGASVNSSVCVVSLDRIRLWCFGPNSGGQVGDGTTEYRQEPVAVIGFE